MTSNGKESQFNSIPGSGNLPDHEMEIVLQLRRDLEGGKDVAGSLLVASSQWSLSEEVVGDVRYQYILAQEAFDLVSLMNRLALDCMGLIPIKDLSDAVFVDEYDLVSTDESLRRQLGPIKYLSLIHI